MKELYDLLFSVKNCLDIGRGWIGVQTTSIRKTLIHSVPFLL